MSSSSNKCRIYFCVYYQGGRAGTVADPRVFHCGLWVEDKNSRGRGHYFHVQFHGRRPVNRPDYPDGWAYGTSVTRSREANWKESGKLIGRILLGKLPSGVGAGDIHDVCRDVRLPNENTDDDCWTWTGRAIKAIQDRGWLARHSWTSLRAAAYDQACSWWDGDRGKVPRNAHFWDIYNTESTKHCVVM